MRPSLNWFAELVFVLGACIGAIGIVSFHPFVLTLGVFLLTLSIALDVRCELHWRASAHESWPSSSAPSGAPTTGASSGPKTSESAAAVESPSAAPLADAATVIQIETGLTVDHAGTRYWLPCDTTDLDRCKELLAHWRANMPPLGEGEYSLAYPQLRQRKSS